MFARLLDKQALENIIDASKDRPVVVFKHSNSCPISSRAYREMEQLEDINLLEIQSARDLSREVEELTGVRHESPQVIILRDGKAVWNASHFDVKAGTVAEAVQAHR